VWNSCAGRSGGCSLADVDWSSECLLAVRNGWSGLSPPGGPALLPHGALRRHKMSPRDLNMTPKQQLESYIKKFSPTVATAARQALVKMRKRLPGAVEFVYDNYNALVIGFGPTMRPSEAVFSIVVSHRRVTLCFLQGAKLADPHGLLQGSGNVVRHLRLTTSKTLDEPEVLQLMKEALRCGKVPLDTSKRRQMVIRPVSVQPRPRRPSTKKH